MHVVMARVYSSGIVVLTSECKFFAVTDLADPRPRKMADILGMMGRPGRRAYSVPLEAQILLSPFISSL
jgi:hypothetical protein